MNKILVVEDDINLRENLLDLLDAENFDTIAAKDGLIGLELANQEIPDLIICDVNMPELDGYSLLSKLRQNIVTSTIPFVFLSGKSDKKDFRQGMRLGADDYLTKPFTKDELLETIKCRLEKQFTLQKKSQHELHELRQNITLALPHEMRTPLNGILGFSQILINENETLEKQEIYEMAEGIYKSGHRLLDFTQRFLLYAKLESIATDPEQIKLIQSQNTYFPIDSLISLIKKRASKVEREKDLKIFFNSTCKVKIAVNRLYTIIEELIDNCFKFSESNTSISVSSAIENNYLILSFSNYGRGMSASEIRNLGAYRQFNRRVYEQQGSGLGLSIVKRLAELHQGSLNIQSNPGDKTTVQVKLPCI
ncbi:signal transduction histidine kinase [Rivularia sp. PCC 7116]|uniref:hybrid sensor histidine kinase/response regulator n=1 Tax=Rivularia sp. PCC 7116 TaxID=373994 RepID=UPI00029EF752|nr:response regulator [Rivularia sp. PCC 7116]AFY56115.1 signal transduction histidine kinase [Rivularia sp. PCC 7116]